MSDSSPIRRALALLPILFVLAGATACDANFWDPTRFGPMRQVAPIVVLPDPGSGPFGGRYGELVVGYSTWVPRGLPETYLPASRIGAAGGIGSPFAMFAGFDDSLLYGATTTGGLRPTLPSRFLDGCTNTNYCGPGSSMSIVPVPTWDWGTGIGHGCFATPAGLVTQSPLPPDELLQVRCETSPDIIVFVDVPDSVRFGFSAAPLPMRGGIGCTPPIAHPMGAALFGAPDDLDGAGAIYTLEPPPAAVVRRIDLDVTFPITTGLGHALATSEQADGTMLVAAATKPAPGIARQVVLLSLTGSLDAGLTATVHACLTGAGDGFGHALVFADLDADGLDELVVGGAEAQGSTGGMGATDAPISIWQTLPLRSLSAAGCDGTSTAPAAAFELECPTTVEGVVCGADTNYAAFGTSLATGDIDGDGDEDLVVGAPFTVGSTGAVLVFPGGTLSGLSTGVGRVVTSTMRSGALYGFSVSTMRGTDRDEILVGVPGTREVQAVFCTDFDGDRTTDAPPDALRRCIARGVGVPVPMCGGGSDAGVMDAGVMDAGDFDAGDFDAGDFDAGDFDAGDFDAGDVDAGDDAGITDAGDFDAPD